MTTAQARKVHLVGSVPLSDPEHVFRSAASHLGARLRRMPDGETGDRLGFIRWQLPVFMQNPELELESDDPAAHGLMLAPGQYRPRVRLHRREGVAPEELQFNALGYAQAAAKSWDTFSRLQRDGDLPEEWRFLVTLPTPLAPVISYIEPDDQDAVERAYEAAMRAEVAAIAECVPHKSLAIQWNVAAEIAILEGVLAPPVNFADPEHEVLDRLVRYATWVPDDVEVGYHLCYGDNDHQHFKQPDDTAVVVRVANGLSRRVGRQINWLHFPVPRDRDDEAYFAPLTGLERGPGTELYLGLVHLTGGVEGTKRRIDAAARVVSDFGISTECGLGRRPPETVAPILQVLADAAGPAS
jgi:hypothetical protein